MPIRQLIETAAALLLLTTAAWVAGHARTQPQKRALLLGCAALLALLGGVVLWGLWVAPPDSGTIVPAARVTPEEAERTFRKSQMALPTDTPLQIIQKMGCAVCHKIPTVPHATVGVNGPVLTLKTTAPQRLASPGYRAAVAAGCAGATTAKEYVMESIVDPAAFIVPGYDPQAAPNTVAMFPHYRQKFTPEALELLALFLLTIDEEAAQREGLLPMS
jgi:hypothetical protein